MKKWIIYSKSTNKIIGVYYSTMNPSIDNEYADYFEVPDTINFTSKDDPIEIKNKINENLQIREIVWEKIN